MIITCDQCKTRFKIKENLIDKPAFKVRCSKCKNLFTVFKEPQDEKEFLLEDEIKPFHNRIITISNQKGGVSKTSTCLNLGVSLSALKKRVLLVDFDVQSNLTTLLGYKQAKSFYEVLHSENADIASVILKTKYPNLWLLPSNSRMAILTKKYLNENNFEHLLKGGLDLIKDRFDHILIDTPPSVELFTINALVASDYVIIPSQCEYLSLNGIDQVEKMISIIAQKNGREIDYRILTTMFDEKNTASRVLQAKMKKKYKDRLFNTMIDYDVKIQESQIVNQPVIYYDRKSTAARQYINLAKEVIGE